MNPNLYILIGQQQGQLVTDKQAAYGDMIRGAQDVFKILYPEGIKPEQYDDALLVLRVVDKLGRITRGQKKAFDESPWRDIIGYGILGTEQDERAMEEDVAPELRCSHCGEDMDTMHALITHKCPALVDKILNDERPACYSPARCPSTCTSKEGDGCLLDESDKDPL